MATPTGQVFRWHLRIMMQPSAISGAVREAELLGAEQGGDHHVAAGLELPSVCSTTRLRRSFSTSV